jgi:hypothetical protein
MTNPDVLVSPRMPIHTEPFGRPVEVTTAQVLPVGNRLQMIRATAITHSTEVIQLESFRYRTHHQFVDDQVCRTLAAIGADATISRPVSTTYPRPVVITHQQLVTNTIKQIPLHLSRHYAAPLPDPLSMPIRSLTFSRPAGGASMVPASSPCPGWANPGWASGAVGATGLRSGLCLSCASA